MKTIQRLQHSVSTLLNLRQSASICGSKKLLLSIVGFLVAGSISAELNWKSTSQNIQVHPLQASATVLFKFTNVGDESITINELKPSCGCITGSIGKKTYKPGELGTVEVTFKLDGRRGPQLKGLEVITESKESKRTNLLINTNIPKTYAPDVKRVVWDPGEGHAPKTVRLTNASATPFSLEKAVPVHEGISVKLNPVREGFEYDLVITPSEGLSKTLIPIIIHPNRPDGIAAVRTFKVYALVK